MTARKGTPSSKKRLCEDIGDIPDRIVERFLSRVLCGDGCWDYPMAGNSDGYKKLEWGEGGRKAGFVMAHRLAYMLWRGPIFDDLTVDHLCHNPACVNPSHLALATLSANARRSIKIYRTHCPHGHAYDEKNTYRRINGHRVCRECNRIRMAATWARQHAAS